MGKIKQLPPQEAHKIAAGEVIERPANIVKELIENALDAHATKIEVHVKAAGTELIRIIDNGNGMDKYDAEFCFARHATSKIISFDDLAHCTTFGFRGEALTSIAAISKITLSTKESTSSVGTKIEKQSNETEISEIGCNNGTDIAVKDLFYNVPARKKFLKSPATEWRHINLLFQAFCFSYPNIHFSLYHDEQLIYNCPPVNQTLDRILQLWQMPNIDRLMSVEHKHEEIAFKGVISNHQLYRYDRNSLFFFVNSRWIRNASLAKAVMKGYLNVLPRERFPVTILSLELNPAEIDINIHPRKEEIRFGKSHLIEQQITQLIKKTLEKNFVPVKQNVNSFNVITPFNFNEAQYFQNNQLLSSALSMPPFVKGFEEFEEANRQEILVSSINYQDYKFLGTFAATYLLLEYESQLLIIDQHAAHERILYEQFKSRFGNIPTIELLFPVRITLSSDDIIALRSYHENIAQHGLIIEEFSHEEIIVRSIPIHLKESSLSDLIKDILSIITKNQNLEQDLFLKKMHEQLHAQMACKGAVKAGDILAPEKINQLVRDLFITENRFACPHGRPTTWTISQLELEKKFKRKI
jgi:DNA mismatch repair protein MutL